MRSPLRDRARGRWRAILPLLGINPSPRFVKRKNCPCPMCGGKDRFRLLDTAGAGTWVCTHCGGGNGIDLVMGSLGLDFSDAAQRIEEVIGEASAVPSPPKPDPARARAKLRSMWNGSSPVTRGDLVDTYLRSRDVGLDMYPPVLRTAIVNYYDNAIAKPMPAMLAMVHGPEGKPVTIHRTYLAPDGTSKAAVEKPRKLVSAVGDSPTIRLTPAARALGIAEGIETALATTKLFSIPTWSVISTHGIETFEPPAEVRRLVIFGDHDQHGAGQKAAHSLAARLVGHLSVDVRIPDQPGDWNDVLRGQV